VFSTKPALIVAVAVGLFSAAEVFAAPPSKVQAKPTAIAIQGRSATFGPYSMKVGDGLNIRAKFGFTIWDKNKPNEVNMLNSENHVYYRDTAEGWLKWNRRGVPVIDITSVELVDKPTVSGLPCNHYIGYQMLQKQKVKVADFVCLQKAPCDQKVVEFWCKHFLLPPKCGFPIAVKQRVLNSMEFVLVTATIREIPASTVSFAVPKDYKRTEDKASLYFADLGGGMSKSDLESFFQQPLK
jgi:hypothetical protein